MTEAQDDTTRTGLRARLFALRTADPATQAWWLAAALLVFVFTLLCLHAIGTLWLWGHNGFNGAAFAQAARNSLRFGMVGQAQYYMGLEPPPATEIYTHHPMALHAHLIAVFAIFGDAAWVARLVPAVYSVACLVMLMVAAKRWFGPAVALTAGAVWAMTPLNLIFANMVNHEQGGIFWCLFYVHMYLLWLDAYRTRHFVGIMVGVTMAVQFDWPGYYIALFVVLHAFFRGLRLQERWLQWRPEFTFVVVFSVVVLANFALFYSFIVDTRGDFTEMQSAFEQRSSSPDDYWERMKLRMPDMHTTGFLAVLALWLVTTPILVAKRTLGVALLFPMTFVFAQAVHSLVFKEAGYIHVYWTWFLNPAMAIGVALVLVTLARAPAALLASSVGTRLRGGIEATPSARAFAFGIGIAAFVVAPLAWQARVGWEQMQWGFATGSAAYHAPYDDRYEVARFIQKVGERYDRDNADFWIHDSLELRIETLYYIDAPYRISRSPRLTPMLSGGERSQIFVTDMSQPQDWASLERMLREHTALVYDDRFVAIDLASDAPSIERWRSTPHSGLLWSWFVQPDHPRVTWELVGDDDAARDALIATFIERSPPVFGGATGNDYAFSCPRGDALEGLYVARREGAGSRIVSGVIADCADAARDGDRLRLGHEATASSIMIGTVTRDTGRHATCNDGEVVVGIHGSAGSLVDSLGIVCARAEVVEDGDGWHIETANVRRRAAVGVRSGFTFEFVCPSRSVVTGVVVRGGALVDAFGVTCTAIDDAWCDGACVSADDIAAAGDGSGEALDGSGDDADADDADDADADTDDADDDAAVNDAYADDPAAAVLPPAARRALDAAREGSGNALQNLRAFDRSPARRPASR